MRHISFSFKPLAIIILIVALLVLIGNFTVRSEVVKRTVYFILMLGALIAIAAMIFHLILSDKKDTNSLKFLYLHI